MHGTILQFALILACNLLDITAQARLSIINVSKFPHSVDREFQLKVGTINQTETIDRFLSNTMIIRIKDNKENEKGKYIFDYGRKDKIDDIIDNDFISTEKWIKNQDSTGIQISIFFKRNSNGHIIQIFDLQAQSFEIRKAMINNLTLATLLYNETIELVAPSKLQLTVNSTGGDNVTLVLGQLAVAKCRSYDGIPIETPDFTNLQHLVVVKRRFVIENNEMEIKFRVRPSDDLKYLNCSAGQSNVAMMIRVLHPTTTIIIEPPVNKTLEVNSSISCYSKDGYPQAQTQWHFIDGPANASSFYKIINEGKTLHMKAHAATETFWRFNCSAKSNEMINESIFFIMKDKYCDNFCLNARIKILKQTTDLQNKINDDLVKINRKFMETLAENQRKQNDRIEKHDNEILIIKNQINKSIEILQDTSRNQLRILQESIASITKKSDSINQQNKQEIDEAKPIWRPNVIGAPDLECTIGGISTEMNKGGYLDKYFYPGLKVYEIWLTIKFRPDKLQIHLWSIKNNQSKAIYPLQLNATISVINSASVQYYKETTKSFVLDTLYANSPYFIFTKNELADVIRDDSITIKCFIKFK